MKKSISLFLSALALVSACLLTSGCTANGNNSSSKKEETIVGTWTAMVDFSPLLLEELSVEDEAFTKYLELDNFYVACILNFNEDNTYTLDIDEEAFKKTAEKTKKALTDAMVKYIEEMLKESGTGLTIEDYEREIGMSMEDAVTEALFVYPSIDPSFDTQSGEYSLNGTELTMDKIDVYTIKIVENTLTFINSSMPNSKAFAILKDAVWKRN